jgi:creatinine amidohydrolase
MILDDVTMPEYERGLAASRTVLIPFGSLEEHGAHLPLSTDTLQVVEVCRRVGERTGAHVAPAVPYGVCRSSRNHPGTVGVGTATLRAIAVDLVRDFYRHGMRAFVLISGHAGKTHLLTLVDAGEQLLDELPEASISVISEYHEAQRAGAGVVEAEDDSHAGEIETSRVLFLRPELVKGTSPAEWPDFPDARLVRDKRRHWRGGVWGDPAKASADKGRVLTELAVARVTALVRELEDYRESPAGGPAPPGGGDDGL